YENEVLVARQFGQTYDYIVPHSSIMIENPVALVDKNVDKHGAREVAEGFMSFLWMQDAQRAYAQYGLRPAVPTAVGADVLVRFRFSGKGLLNTMIDMPFAIPTLVTGVMLVALYGPQRTLGAWLNAHGVQVIFATPGIVLALLVITYPFVIRAVQPVLMET